MHFVLYLTVLILFPAAGVAMEEAASFTADQNGLLLDVQEHPSISDSSTPSQTGSALKEHALGMLPLYFIENQGQLDREVDYYVQGKDRSLFFTSKGVTFALVDNVDDEAKCWAVKLDFVGARSVKPRCKKKQAAVFSYFKGRPEEWKSSIPTYGELVYENLWPGIDLVYSGTTDQLKYEFIVKPGADPKRICLAYRGAEKVFVNGARELCIETPLGGFRDEKPFAYQLVAGKRNAVSMEYALKARAGDEPYTFGFEIGDYDTAAPLVLDPAVRIYCGYIGGARDDFGTAIQADYEGNIYVTGYTNSNEMSFPVYSGPDVSFNNGKDAFIAKVHYSGTKLVYCGYIGGAGDDHGTGIAVDYEGQAYMTGYTSSDEATFPVVDGPDLTFNQGMDAFVLKLGSAGKFLHYCGYIGGQQLDYGTGISVDNDGHAFVTGHTTSDESSFPVSIGPDLFFNGGKDAFIAKVGAVGTGLEYCGYIGGALDDSGKGIMVDREGCAYVIGSSASDESTFPAAVGPDTTFNGGVDAFIAKVDLTGTGLDYCGYIGGTGDESGNGIVIDQAYRAFVTGHTSSDETSFPVRIGPDLFFNGGQDGFVARVTATGAGLDYCGYLGGAGIESCAAIALDALGRTYVTGYTNSDETSFPVKGGFYPLYNNLQDAFVAMVLNEGTKLVFCGYIGGVGDDFGTGIAVDGTGSIYVTGYTSSDENSFPVNGGPDPIFNTGNDAFVAKISLTCCVDGSNVSGPWTGSPDAPFMSIQDGIDSILLDEPVCVMPGTYVENLVISKDHVKLIGNEGADETTISSANPEESVVYVGGNLAGVEIEGFTIRNGNLKDEKGAGIHCGPGSSLLLTRNIIRKNIGYRGGGIFCGSGATITMNHNLLFENKAYQGAGVYCDLHSALNMTNNTVADNTAYLEGGAIFSGASDLTLTNSIFWNNWAYIEPEIHAHGGTVDVTYCDVKDGYTGTGNIDADPLFVDADQDDYHLTHFSPCINRGNHAAAAALDIDGDPRPFMGTVEMGADEYVDYHLLEADAFSLSAATGGKINFSFNAGFQNGSRWYFLLGSVTGTAPGTPLPNSIKTLPINKDFFTDIVISFLNTPIFTNFMGTMSAFGTASATLNTLGPIPGNEGIVMSFAYTLYKPYDFVSNPVSIEILP